jgi:phosphoesterase RecJ-like protein
MNEILTALQGRQRFLVTSHARPDGDAVGSVLACTHMLRAMGKQADPVLRDGVPHIYRHLPGAAEVRVVPRVDATEYDAAIILECDSVARTRLEGVDGLFLINIDHHDTISDYAHVNWYEPDASATAELIHKIAVACGVGISRDMAVCLYTAVLTDTGSFCYAGTTGTTFELAGELVRAGADPVQAARNVYFSYPPGKMKLLGVALRTLKLEGNFSWMHITRDDVTSVGAVDEDCEGLVNYALGIDGVQVAAFFREMGDGYYRVSLRSKGEVNVADVAEMFGGGGHSAASGFAISGPLQIAVRRVLSELADHDFHPGDGSCASPGGCGHHHPQQ